MEYYMEKTYYKTASLISNSCQSIAVLAGQTTEVSNLAFEYGKNLVCIFLLQLSYNIKLISVQEKELKCDRNLIWCVILISGIMQGLAYQLIDDVLDFTGTSASLGKGSLSDIKHVTS